MNNQEIFALALGISAPWETKSIKLLEIENSNELHIHIDFKRGSKFKGRDGKEYTAYDTVQRTWQHLNFFQYKCFLHARVPRVRQANGETLTQPVPWARKGSGFTLMFESFSMLLIENEMPISSVAKIMGVYPQRIWTIFHYWIAIAHNNDPVDDITQLGFDETSRKKGHNYVTTAVDLKTRRVIFASKGKDSKCIAKTVEYLAGKKAVIDNIRQVCIDMSPAFISGCVNHLPNAEITFDKFHIVKEVNKAMDELRRLERKGNELLKGHKYTFLKGKLSPELESEKDFLLIMYPKLGDGYWLVQMFKEFWDIKKKEDAMAYLGFWCDIAMDTGIQPFKKVVQLIQSHWRGIVSYIDSKINNGILEGINSKIQLAKKRARGYRNTDNFISMIYFLCGKLKFNYPRYFM
jgi:transposase